MTKRKYQFYFSLIFFSFISMFFISSNLFSASTNTITIENFENSSAVFNLLNHEHETYTSEPQAKGSHVIISTMSYTGTGCMEINYVINVSSAWSVLVEFLAERDYNNIVYDASNYNSVEFYLRGKTGNENPKFAMNWDDGSQYGKSASVTLKDYASIPSSNWQKYVIPFSDFNGMDKTRLRKLEFSFSGTVMSGTIYVDDISFKASTTFDTINPGKITDLAAETGENYGQVKLTWTVPNEDGTYGGRVSAYQIKYSTNPVSSNTTSWWNQATDVDFLPTPLEPGKKQQYIINFLVPDNIYYFGIKSIDDSLNYSIMSDTTNAYSLAQILPNTNKKELKIEDFEDISAIFNLLGNEHETYTSGAQTTGSHVIITTMSNTGIGSMEINYGVSNTVDWSVLVEFLAERDNSTIVFDASNYDSVEFYMRGKTGTENPRFAMNWDDGSQYGKSAFVTLKNYAGISSSSWQKYKIPFSDFNGMDKTKLRKLEFNFANAIMSGTIYVDDLSFKASTTLANNIIPGKITDLMAETGENEGEIKISWTAPHEDGTYGGSVTLYQIKYSTNPILSYTTAWWDQATSVIKPPAPSNPGEKQLFIINSLLPASTYYVGIKSSDDSSNYSVMSDTKNAYASAKNTPPSAPAITKLTTDNKCIEINWTLYSEKDFKEYKVYFDTDNADIPYTYIFSTGTSTNFKIIPILQKTTYFIKISANDNTGYESFSVSTSIYVKTPDIITTKISSGTITLDDLSGGKVEIEIPFGALNKNETITITRLDPNSVEKGNGSAENKIPAAVYDFTPEGLKFNTKVNLTMYYLDSSNDGIDDVSGSEVEKLKIFYWDGYSWRFIGGTTDTINHCISAAIIHFSRYAIFSSKELTKEDYKPKEKIITPAKLDNKNDFATFSVPIGTEIYIYDSLGNQIKKIVNKNIWDGKDEDGNLVESGIYIYHFRMNNEKIYGTIVVAK